MDLNLRQTGDTITAGAVGSNDLGAKGALRVRGTGTGFTRWRVKLSEILPPVRLTADSGQDDTSHAKTTSVELLGRWRTSGGDWYAFRQFNDDAVRHG